MTNTKFIVKVNRGGTRAAEYVRRIDSAPVTMTLNRKLALVMGKFTAEDAVKSIQTSRLTPELVSVQVRDGHPSLGTKLGVRSRSQTSVAQPAHFHPDGGFHGIFSPGPSTGSSDSL
ncbi:MAG: hypothetical protein WCC04_19965 [Terriglobales bacterium]